MKILPMYGGTEWAADPCAALVDPSYYDEYQREANAIFKAHPKIDKVRFGYVRDVSLFLDTTTDFDMHVVGVDENGEMLYVVRSGTARGALMALRDTLFVLAGVVRQARERNADV
jgi:hypothetical protein